MRSRPSRLLATIVSVLACLFGLATTATATTATATTGTVPARAPIGGGSVLFNPFGPANNQCTAAFAAADSTYGYLLVGPGCTGDTLYSGDNVLVGPVLASTTPRTGYAVVRVTNTAAWELVSWVDIGDERLPITGSRETPIGGSVCLVDRPTGMRCGTVTAKNQTVTFPWGTVSGLTRTNICVEPRTTGIAYVTDNQAQGIPLGGAGDCTVGGSSYFYPVNKALATYGLRLFTG